MGCFSRFWDFLFVQSQSYFLYTPSAPLVERFSHQRGDAFRAVSYTHLDVYKRQVALGALLFDGNALVVVMHLSRAACAALALSLIHI